MKTIKTMIAVDNVKEKLSFAPKGYKHCAKKKLSFLLNS